jgi:hypothetical protein
MEKTMPAIVVQAFLVFVEYRIRQLADGRDDSPFHILVFRQRIDAKLLDHPRVQHQLVHKRIAERGR